MPSARFSSKGDSPMARVAWSAMRRSRSLPLTNTRATPACPTTAKGRRCESACGERRGHGQRGGVAPAAAQRRDLALVAHALIARDDHHAPAGQLVQDAHGSHLEDLGVEVPVVRQDTALAARERDRVASTTLQRHRQQRHRDALAGGQQQVQLSARGVRVDAARQRQQLVRGLPHRRHHHHHAVPFVTRGADAVGHEPNLLDVGHGASAVLLDDDAHVLGVRPRRATA